MRLSRLKLAGFKSFVDPTNIKMPSNLVGIVGPNGCGKSNTIDAVRWVMGESSAKHLRGESMEDVIFTGSSARKPVGQASVELVFDNSDGTLGGQYAEYAEISVKRQVTREGQSTYYLNGSRCRRRDITDIFLGTGLGPRSYAIIEQGMISRLIEAKPEDLRIYLEEAAGISKYKERRRETENRIRHTRDNLDRLNDLREEVDKQLTRLKRQSTIAEKYKNFKSEERQLRAQLLALRWKRFHDQLDGRDSKIRENEVHLEELIAHQRSAESAIEKERELHITATDKFNEVQAEFYRLGADVSRAEQNIQHVRETRNRQMRELDQVSQSIREAEELIRQDERRIEELTTAMAEDEPAFDQLKESQKFSAEVLARAEQDLQEWQTRWDQFAQRSSEPTQTAQVELSRMDQFERNLDELQKRIQRLESEQETMDTETLRLEIEELIGEEVAGAEDELRLQTTLADADENVQRVRETQQDLAAQLDEARGQVQALRGRKASLEALQQAALGQDNRSAVEWLQRNGLDGKPRLAQQITVAPGWEKAVETVLGEHLESVCVEGIDGLAGVLVDYSGGKISLVEMALRNDAAVIRGDMLRNKIESPLPLDDLLAGIYVSETLEGALALRQKLADGESIVTKRGIWVGKTWLRIGNTDHENGVLVREQELNEVNATLEQAESCVTSLSAELDEFATRLREAETQRDTSQQMLNQALRQLSDVRSQLSGKRQRLEQTEQRRGRLVEELNDAREQYRQKSEDLAMAKERRAEALMQVDEFATQREVLQQEREALREALNEARTQASADRDAGQQIAIRVESMRSSLKATEQSLERMRNQTAHLLERREELQMALEEEDTPVDELELELEAMLERRVTSEKLLGTVRSEVESADQRLREHEQTRVRFEKQAQSLRDEIQREKLETQEVRVRIKTLEEQIAESGFVRAALLELLPEEATVDSWEAQLADIERAISRLGPINLAAIDEYQEQLERKEYLDRQHTDVTDALETLEDAIAKIDKETRSRFKETFDRVNSKLQEFFPRLFGGGQASLEMTGDDLLSTGVSILARPPGKRVSNIHLLSGGEKALTAVAMVFAFFELNPSPFCMLDEVDAPLDDANVGRFCELVREMSSRVQFIFITHNKVTMELSEQLMGVTMQEPGCSRLVAVDVEEAARMVDA
ncbi:chromosome segregation protein SMC [Granulosicoccaceae sp. 1_MG-2023]|nr:chromosome segregation protein SMC [Granulosicoccaceae sp. 1_MG-2023]